MRAPAPTAEGACPRCGGKLRRDFGYPALRCFMCGYRYEGEPLPIVQDYRLRD